MANDLLSGLEGIYGTDLTEQELAAGIKPTAEAVGTPLHRLPGFEYSAAARDFGYIPSAYKLYLSDGFPQKQQTQYKILQVDKRLILELETLHQK